MYATCCDILGLNPGASQVEIKKAYRRKAKLYHPDLNPSPFANQEFIKIKKAFDYLVDYNSHQYTYASYSCTHPSARRSYYERAGAYNRERYEKWQDYMRHFKHRPRKDFDFKTTVFGKIVFYFFHAMFLFIGIYILVSPTLSIISNGITLEQNPAATIFAVIGSSAFGLIMVVMITLSGLSVDLFKHT